ncbi:MAG: hypothetical protein APR63_01050 [Desulfuromonas sp. SDB]|nr:MAG: hypothetical protein APR63_01050 [Desulfuromonas sp. SDB]
MKKLVLLLLGVTLVSLAVAEPLHKPGDVIVKFRNELRGDLNFNITDGVLNCELTSVNQLFSQYQIAGYQQLIPDYDFQQNDDYGLDMIYVFQAGSDQQAVQSVEQFNKNPYVDFAELNIKFESDRKFQADPWVCDHTPNDPYFSTYQWYLSRIDAQSAWDTQTGSHGKIVAIIDDGCEKDHADLSSNYVTGYDYADNDNDPTPPTAGDNHGTHCSGLAAAVANNGTGIASIGYGVGLIGVRTDFYSNTLCQGIYFSSQNGADVISMSWGSSSPSSTIQTAIDDAINNYDIVCLAAAGNDNTSTAHYPAYYSNVVAVAASDFYDQKACFSNYGTWIDISAPGDSVYYDGILSTIPYGTYGWMPGTSMSTPLTAGLVCLMRCQFPSETHTQIEQRLYNAADPMTGCSYYNSGYMGAGRINAANAIGGGGGPSSCDTLTYWDWNNVESGMNYGDPPEWMGMGVRFTPTELSPYSGEYIEQVIFQLRTGNNPSNDAKIYIFGDGTSTNPGDTLYQTSFTVTGDSQWYCINLGANHIPVNSSGDMWILVGFTYESGNYPFSVNTGSYYSGKSDWAWTNYGGWEKLGDYGFYYGWTVGAVICQNTGIEEEIIINNPNDQLRLSLSSSLINNNSYIYFNLPQAGNISLKCYDMAGREIITLINGYQDQGLHQIKFNTLDGGGRELSAGSYLLHLVTDKGTETVKFIITN